MSEPDITALARRLAEQNNVDWRGLRGSGDGGRIVERDVLDYLARVMAGDEALDPTPEPLPEGMEAWPDQDVGAYRHGRESSTLGELRQEIGNAVRDDPAEQSGAATTPPGSITDVTEVDEDVFLFDDEPSTAEPSAGQSDAGFGTSVSSGDDLDDLLVAGDDGAPLVSEDEEPHQVEEEPQFSGFGEVQSRRDEPVAAEESPWGDDISLGRQQHGSASEDAPDIWGAPVSSGDADVDLFTDEEETTADSFDVGFEREPEAASRAGADSGTSDWRGGETPDEPDLWADGHDQAHAPAPEFAEPSGEAFDEPFGETGGEASSEEFSGSGGEGFTLEQGEDEPWAAPASSAEEFHEAESFTEPPHPEPTTFTEPEAFGAFADDQVTVDEPETAAALAGSVSSVSDLEGLPLARMGTMLRRHVDVSALASAQLAVSQELGFEEPLAAASFVLRAVAKAVEKLDASPGQVALASFDGGLKLRRVDHAATMPFGDLVNEVNNDGPEEDEPGIVVADLSGLDVDEVVLDVGMPVVSLGRMLYDNQRGGYRSTLTLTGDLPAEKGARLLARVAELLDSPVRLIM